MRTAKIVMIAGLSVMAVCTRFAGPRGNRWNKARTCIARFRRWKQRIARIDHALCTAYIAKAWCNMAVREIIKLPDKRLRLVSEPIKRIDAGIRKLAEDMFATMYAAPGIGLAAIQVGIGK